MEAEFIWTDGKLIPTEEATVHFLTPALHYGLAIFEGIRAYETENGPAIFRLEEHVERLLNSAHAFGILNFPFTQKEISEAILETVRVNKFKIPNVFINAAYILLLQVILKTWVSQITSAIIKYCGLSILGKHSSSSKFKARTGTTLCGV